MEEILEAKRSLRKAMVLRKSAYSATLLSEFSKQALGFLEKMPEFIQADVVAIYYSMADEVQTVSFIEKWAKKKKILLPVVYGDFLRFSLYTGPACLKSGVFGILEPAPEANSDVIIPDLIIVPGVAFDRQMNRLGRGKGYYDRLFSAVEWNAVKKIGLCFHFQIVPAVPVQETDIRMHCVVTDKGVLGLCFVNE